MAEKSIVYLIVMWYYEKSGENNDERMIHYEVAKMKFTAVGDMLIQRILSTLDELK